MSGPEKNTAFRPKARRPRGFQDRRGPALAAERALVEKISRVYEAWGFERLETPAFEYADALGKFLPDQDRPNEGVFALEDDDSQWMALRYDLTAPLARFVAENFDALPKPYRRWAAGTVWRNEKPGPGRFREFWQCDADTVGSALPAADAEMIAMACEAFRAVGIARGDYSVRISSRRLLNALLDAIGLAESDGRRLIVLRAIDKLDRLKIEGVVQLLGPGRRDESGDFTQGADLDDAAIVRVQTFLNVGSSNQDTLANLSNVVSGAEGEQGIRELADISETLKALGVDGDAQIDPTVVRGLEYYTSTVFEAVLVGFDDEDENKIRYGSIGGGGRYDDLVARFTNQLVPATGFSVGISRLAAALASAKQLATDAGTPVVVLPFDKEGVAECFALAQTLREAGLRAEVYLGGSGTKAQLRYADKRNAPIAVILGADERKNSKVTLKDMKLGAEISKTVTDNKEWREGRQAQITIDQDKLVEEVRRMLQKQDADGV